MLPSRTQLLHGSAVALVGAVVYLYRAQVSAITDHLARCHAGQDELRSRVSALENQIRGIPDVKKVAKTPESR